MEFVIILLKSLLIGGLLGFAAGAGAARSDVSCTTNARVRGI